MCWLCLRENLISDRALYLEYGVRLSDEFTEMPVARSSNSETAVARHRVSVFKELKAHCYFIVSSDGYRERLKYSHTPVDFDDAVPNRVTDLLFFWRPHLSRCILLEKARRHVERREKAIRQLGGIMGRWGVRREMERAVRHCAPRGNWFDRYMTIFVKTMRALRVAK